MKKCLLLMALSASVYAAEQSSEDWKAELQRWMEAQQDEEPEQQPVAQQSPRRLQVPVGWMSANAKQKELVELEQESAEGYSFFGTEDADKKQH